MSSRNIKYQPIPTWVGSERFDSKYEADVFRLLRHQSYDLEYKIEREVPILVKPQGVIFPKRKWKCDFTLTHERLGVLHIEAKGFLTDLWMHQLELLEATNPETFDRVRVITSTPEVKSALSKMSARVYSISTLSHEILDLEFWNLGNDRMHIF